MPVTTVTDLEGVQTFISLLMVNREELQMNPLGHPLEIAVNYCADMLTELLAARSVVEAAKSVSSEPDVLDLLSCYNMGVELLNRLAAYDQAVSDRK